MFIAVILVAWVLAVLAGTLDEFLGERDVVLTVAFFFVPLAIILATYGTIFFIARARGRGVSSFRKVF